MSRSIAAAPETVAATAVVGVGNTLAGDDGAGIVAVERLRARIGDTAGVRFFTLERDVYEIADLLDRAEEFVFVDACVGDSPGRIVARGTAEPMIVGSLHHTDIGAVMHALAALKLVDPFPSWELWGVEVTPPLTLGEGLSRHVDKGVTRLVEMLAEKITTAAPRGASADSGR